VKSILSRDQVKHGSPSQPYHTIPYQITATSHSDEMTTPEWTVEETQAWLDEIRKITGSFDLTRLPEFFAEDAMLRVGQQPEHKGIEAILASMSQSKDVLQSLKHHNVRLDLVGDLIYSTMLIEFVIKADPEKQVFGIHCLTVTTRVPKGQKEEGKVKREDVFMDFSPVLDRMKALGLF